MWLEQLAKTLEASEFSQVMKESLYWFPMLNLVHVIGLLLAAGTIAFWDLRLLGVGLKNTPVSRIGSALLPWTWTGFVIMFGSGSLLVWMRAAQYYGNTFFRLKVLFLILAGLNMMAFHLTVYRSVNQWDKDPVTPTQARIAGGISLLLWFGMMACGRAIGYTLNYAA